MFENKMFENKTKVLLLLTQDALDRARVLAGKATAALKLPVSLQIVLRALIEEGLKHGDRPVLLANIGGQELGRAPRRDQAWRAGGAAGERRNLQAGSPRKRRERRPNRRGKKGGHPIGNGGVRSAST